MTSLNQDMAQKFHKFRVFIKFLAPCLLVLMFATLPLFCEQVFSIGDVGYVPGTLAIFIIVIDIINAVNSHLVRKLGIVCIYIKVYYSSVSFIFKYLCIHKI